MMKGGRKEGRREDGLFDCQCDSRVTLSRAYVVNNKRIVMSQTNAPAGRAKPRERGCVPRSHSPFVVRQINHSRISTYKAQPRDFGSCLSSQG